MKLEIELIPETSFFKNVRSNVSETRWNQIKYKCYARASYKCEICGGIGPKWPVECHEEFSYNEETHIQKLEKLVALCPKCHQVKHIGLAEIQGKYEYAIKHFMKINSDFIKTRNQAEHYVEAILDLWKTRNNIEWILDLELLTIY